MSKKFYPVIHVDNLKQTLTQIIVAKKCKADGVFMINHWITCGKMLSIYKTIRIFFPDLWIGLNFLGLNNLKAAEIIPLDANGLWVDNANINEFIDEQPIAKRLIEKLKERKWPGELFGGVAFKYCPKVKDLVKATDLACNIMDIVTTSGNGTGIAPSKEKIDLMSAAAHKNGKKLAIASGITPENINNYKNADIFMVATGISFSDYYFDIDKTEMLSHKIKKLNQKGDGYEYKIIEN